MQATGMALGVTLRKQLKSGAWELDLLLVQVGTWRDAYKVLTVLQYLSCGLPS